MRWTVHGERSLYESEWVNLALVDVEIPGGERFDHHVVRLPLPAAGCVVHDRQRGVLLLWRHRFITDTWGFEIPAGRIDAGEAPIDAARRECLEEAGWEPLDLVPLGTYHPGNGLTDQTFHLFTASGAAYVGEPSDPSESERVEWVPVAEVRRHIEEGRVTEGMSITGLLWLLLHLADPA